MKKVITHRYQIGSVVQEVTLCRECEENLENPRVSYLGVSRGPHDGKCASCGHGGEAAHDGERQAEFDKFLFGDWKQEVEAEARRKGRTSLDEVAE